MTKEAHYLTKYLPKTLIVGVQAPYNNSINFESYFEEFRNLVISNRIKYDEELIIKLRKIEPAYFFTQGKLERTHRILR